MSQFTVEQLKTHLVVVDDDGSEDAQIIEYAESAEDWITQHVRRDLDSEFPEKWPAACRQAIKMLVTMFYEKGDTLFGDDFDVGFETVKQIIAPFRNMS